mmetsp:Transcript_31972/g.91730  ORF Transcript_31972/g.91730 Transcript_31972/m.91730 type:complete len:425 (-) Transcript_31972:84-1358(-)
MMNPIQALFDAMGDASGHLGESSNFNVTNTDESFQVSAHLPGHRLDQTHQGKDPLSVRMVGRSLVIRGRHMKGPVTFEFQRSFWVPPQANVSAIAVNYSTTTGKLIISIPKRPRSEGEEDGPVKDEGSGAPVPFRDLQESMQRFFGDSQRLPRGGNLRSAPGPSQEGVKQLFGDVVERPHQQHTVDSRVKEDNTTYLGCFAEDELPPERSELAETGGYSAARRRAQEGRAGRFFALAASATPAARSLGFAFDGNPQMPPRYGTGGCGLPCQDNTDAGAEPDAGAVEHWCGCAPGPQQEAADCEGGVQRFAIYALPLEDGSRAALPISRPIWHLGKAKDGTATLEVHAPPGRKLKQDAGKLLVVNGDERSPAEGSATSDPLAQVGVPVDLREHDCSFSDGGSQMRCRLKEEGVRDIPVRYTNDEL